MQTEVCAFPFAPRRRKRSTVGLPLTPSAVRLTHSGGNLLGVFSAAKDLYLPIFELVIQPNLLLLFGEKLVLLQWYDLGQPSRNRLYVFMRIPGKSTYRRFPAWIRAENVSSACAEPFAPFGGSVQRVPLVFIRMA
jgi:hypothetical protein